MPANYHVYCCPLNVLVYHTGHQHYPQHRGHFGHVANCFHHNHYQHLITLSRSNVALMLLGELMAADGVQHDWSPHLAVIVHICLVNLDSIKQLIGEHAKKLLLHTLLVVFAQHNHSGSGGNTLVDTLLASIDSIVDSRSIIYDRKYTMGTCHYNYNFKHSSAPFAPAPPAASTTVLTTTTTTTATTATIKRSKQSMSLHSPAAQVQMQMQIQQVPPSLLHKAHEHLSALLATLAACKNSPVWPYELIKPQTAAASAVNMTSIRLLNQFVSHLQALFKLCSEMAKAPAASASSPTTTKQQQQKSPGVNNNNNINSMSVRLATLDADWSHYALITSLNTTSRHYASRSLQIYRALGIRIASLATVRNLTHRLIETVADVNEDVQGYVADLLLTLHMNASLIVNQPNDATNALDSILNMTNDNDDNGDIDKVEQSDKQQQQHMSVLQMQKQKSRSLQVAHTSSSGNKSSKQEKAESDMLEMLEASATATAVGAMSVKKKSATVAHMRHASEQASGESSSSPSRARLGGLRKELNLAPQSLGKSATMKRPTALARHDHLFTVIAFHQHSKLETLK